MENLLQQEMEWLSSRWLLLAFMGVTSIILGSIAIAISFLATLATVFFLGCLMLAGGAVHLFESFSTRRWRGFFGHVLATVLYGMAGWYMIATPGVSAAALTLVISLVLAVQGLYQMIASLVMRYASWGWRLLQGALGVTLGILIFAQWPVSALWVIGTFVGIDLLFHGWATLMLAMAVRAGTEPLMESVRRGLEERRVRDRRLTA